MQELLQKLKNFAKTLKRRYRKKEHEAYLWNSIYMLRSEVVDDVLQGSISGRTPVKELKRKAGLIRKYSRRLKLIKT